MLTKEDNEILTRVGPGTPMGNLLRRYWMPAVLSTEVPSPDSPPVRVRLMSEDLVAFRDTNGSVGLFAVNCPHRGASLFFGRNEETGLRCVYHGWKFDVTGACVDMPSEPAESNFKGKVRAKAYPTHESGGVVWTYMGPPEKMLPFRDFGTEFLPREKWRSNKVISYCNFVQALEGDIDSSHISYLHRNLADFDIEDDGTDKPGYPSNRMSTRIRGYDRAPVLEVEDTPYGFRYAGIRTTPKGHQHIRLTVFVMPIMPMVSNLPLGTGIVMKVPIDDETCWRWNIAVHDDLPASNDNFFQQRAPRSAPMTRVPGIQERTQFAENDYLLDREKQRTFSYTGILGTGEQDLAVTESMGSIYDRSHEHLGTTDSAIIRMRRLLVQAAKDLDKGIEPPGIDPSYPYHLIRSAEKIILPGEDWRKLATTEDETYVQIAVPAL
jgi:phthalate 4,5-dioxygenase